MNDPARRLVQLSFWVYLPMIASGIFARSPGTLRIETGLPRFGLGLGVAAAAAVAVVVGSHYAARHTTWGRALKDEFQGLLQGLDSPQILMLALLSAFGEELLFRGVLHPRLGLETTAVIFGLFHFPYRRAMVPWTLFAVAMGLGLGVLVDVFHSLWPAILLHFLVNYLNLHDLTQGEAKQD